MINFTVFGEPNSLKRHRAFRRGKALVMVDASKTDKQDFLAQAIKNKPKKPLDVPIILEVHAFFMRPKAHFNKKGLKNNAPHFCSKTPDIDNILKFVGDALNKVFWTDDKLIVRAICSKRYDDVPRVEIMIKEAKEETI